MAITWDTKSVKISDLKEYKYNPRRITKKRYDDMVRSLKEDGYHKRVMIDVDNTIIDGNQRKKAFIDVFGKDYKIEVLFPDKKLTEKEIDRINIRANLYYGSYDYDILSSRFDPEELYDFGMDENMIVGFYEDIEDDKGSKKSGKKEKPKCDCSCCKH